MKQRLLAGLLAVCLMLTLCPAALADEDAPGASDAPAQAAEEENIDCDAPAAAEDPDGGTGDETGDETGWEEGEALEGAASDSEEMLLAASDKLAPSGEIAEFIKLYEGFSAQPYEDNGGWYIGYGMACDPEDWPDGITEEEASRLLWERLEGFAESVHTFLDKYGVSVTQSQFDALVSMTYNFGPSWLSVSNRLPSYLVNGIDNYSEWEIVNAFGAWCHINGAISEPLLSRRIAEAMVFLYGDYSRDVSAWCRLDIDAAGGSVSTDVWCYRVGQSYGILPATSRSGYTFAGWQRDDGTLLSASDIAPGTVHIKAVWSALGIYSDITPEDWFYDVVREMTGKNVISGYDDGTFRPNNPVTRGEALKLVILAAGYRKQDAKAGQHWAAGYRSFAVGRGFIRESDYADLDAAISRDGIADLAAAALMLNTSAYTDNPFADSARPSVLALYGEGIYEGSINESGQRVFKGSDEIIRAEIAAVVQRIPAYVARWDINFAGNHMPIDRTIAANGYDTSKFRTENGRIYYDDPSYDVRYGIDVAYYQGDVNWRAVAADGIDFAILRAGYRGYGSRGSLNEDSRFAEYVKGAAAAGLDIGLYIFSQAVSPQEAVAEAQYVLSLIKKYNVKVTFPIAFDWEPQEYANSRTRMSIYDYNKLTDCALAFCSTIKAAGYTPIVYGNPTLFYLRYGVGRLRDYDIWLAHYTDRTTYRYDFQIWQYGSGRVNGIAGEVDMDIAFVDYARK